MIVGLGIKRTGDWTSSFVQDLDTQGFLKRTQELFDKRGLRLLYFTTYMSGRQRRWAGVYRSGNWGHRFIHDMSSDTFVKTTQKLFDDEGLRLEAMDTYVQGGKQLWAGSYRSGDWGHRLHIDRSRQAIIDESNALHKQGLRLTTVRTYVKNGQQMWAGIYRSGNWGNRLLLDRDFASFAKDTQDLFDKEGLRLVDVTSYMVDGKRRWAAICRSGDWGIRWFFALNRQHFAAVNQALFDEQKLRLTAMSYWDQLVPTVRLHVKTLVEPDIPIDTMVANMRTVFATAGIGVEVASRESLSLPALEDLDVGELSEATEEEQELWSHRNNVETNELPVYFVRNAPGLNGEALFIDGQPGCMVASYASNWTLAHEIGHLLDLPHCDDPKPPDPNAVPALLDRLMTGRGTGKITNPPPDLIKSEVTKMLASKYSIDS